MALSNISGIGHLAITMHPIQSCLLSMAATSAIPPLSSPAANNVQLVQGHPPGSPARVTARVSSGVSSDRLAFQFCTSSLPLLINAGWSAFLNSYWPLSASMRYPVMTQDSFQFSGAVSVGSGSSRPACFNGRCVTPRPTILSPTLWNRDYMKDPLSAF